MARSSTTEPAKTAEAQRLDEAREQAVPWRQWGPYLSERQWGTVREDYSEDGNAWDYFTHDQARSRAYHWGEDGIAGISDDKQRLCFAVAPWNGKDPILKERIYGLANSEANHGEDVKEYYFYLDSTPTHSYMKYLYKYSQTEYPYLNLIETNRHRGRLDPEYEFLQAQLWQQAVEINAAKPQLNIVLFVQSLNQAIDLQETRLFAARNRVPGALFLLLYAVAAVAVGFSGFAVGLEGKQGRIPTALLGALVASVIGLIADIDQPRSGFITINQQPIFDVQASLKS